MGDELRLAAGGENPGVRAREIANEPEARHLVPLLSKVVDPKSEPGKKFLEKVMALPPQKALEGIAPLIAAKGGLEWALSSEKARGIVSGFSGREIESDVPHFKEYLASSARADQNTYDTLRPVLRNREFRNTYPLHWMALFLDVEKKHGAKAGHDLPITRGAWTIRLMSHSCKRSKGREAGRRL